MLTRRLSLRLFAPTVLLSVLLVGTCVLVALYLNRLHVNVATDLEENFQSMEAAVNLETTVRALIDFLHQKHRDPVRMAERVAIYQKQLRAELAKSETLANRKEEQDLVGKIR